MPFSFSDHFGGDGKHPETPNICGKRVYKSIANSVVVIMAWMVVVHPVSQTLWKYPWAPLCPSLSEGQGNENTQRHKAEEDKILQGRTLETEQERAGERTRERETQREGFGKHFGWVDWSTFCNLEEENVIEQLWCKKAEKWYREYIVRSLAVICIWLWFIRRLNISLVL